MTQRTQNIIEQILDFEDNEKIEIISSILQKSLSDKLQTIYLDNNILFILNFNQFKTNVENENISQRNILKNSLSKIQSYQTFKNISDPILWQKESRDDR